MKKNLKYFTFIITALALITSCSKDSDDSPTIDSLGEVRFVLTLDEAPQEEYTMQINVFPLTDFSEGVVTATYENTDLSKETALPISTTDFDTSSAIHNVVTTSNANGMRVDLLFPSDNENKTVDYTVQFYFNDSLEFTESFEVTFDEENSSKLITWDLETGYSER